MALDRTVVHFISVMCESALVGAYAVLIGLVVWVLRTSKRSMPTMHKVLFGASILMFLISIAHLGLVMQEVTVPLVPIANFQTQIVLSVFQFVIGDLILIWRVWIIWGRNHWVVIGPLIIMIVAAGFVFNVATLTETRTFFTAAPTALIVANTSICTLLIAGRIWYMRRQLAKSGGAATAHSASYKGALALIVESGVLYALAHLISLILDHIHSPGLSIMLNLEIPLIGILPTLIIVFVHFQMIPANRGDTSYSRNPPGHIAVNTFSTRTAAVSERMEFKNGTLGTTTEDYDLEAHIKKEGPQVV